MGKLFEIGIIILLFLGANVLGYFGIGTDSLEASAFQRIHPAFYVIFIVFCYYITKKIRYKNVKEETFIIIFLSVLYIISRITGSFIDTAYIINTFFVSILIAIILTHVTDRYLNKIRKIIICFFIVECIIAIIERILLKNFFPLSFVEIQLTSMGFRSTALQVHPLQNALCVSIIMSFILSSSMATNKKYLLWSLGLIALLCFNTRSSIIVNGGVLFLFVLYTVFQTKKKAQEKFFLIVFVSIGIVVLLLLMQNYGWGGRLLEMGVFDESSAAVRVQNFDLLDYSNMQELLWGMSSLEMEMAMTNAGMENIILENYWLFFIFRFGVIPTVVLVFLYFLFFKKLLKDYTFHQKGIVIVTFLLISSTNNSLATSTPAISIFVLCCFAFRNELFKKRSV